MISNKEAKELLDCIKQAEDRKGDWLVALERAHDLAVAVVEDSESHPAEGCGMRNVRAAELKRGDEFYYSGELHRVTVNDEYGDEERKIYTYVVARPRTAPFVIWFANDQAVTLE